MKGSLVLAIILCSIYFIHASSPVNLRNIHLKAKLLNTVEEHDFVASPEQQKHVRELQADNMKWMIHMKGPVTFDNRVSLEKFLGVKLGQYLPHNTFIVSGPVSLAEKAKTSPLVLWVGAYLPDYKISEYIFNQEHENEEGVLRMQLSSDAVPNRDSLKVQWEQALKAKGITSTFESFGKFYMSVRTEKITPELVRFLAEQHETLWVERAPIFKPTSQWASRLIQNGGTFSPNSPSFFSNFTVPLVGAEQVIGLFDTGVNKNSCYFDPNQVKVDCSITGQDPANCGDSSGHGTFMAATIIGKQGGVSYGIAPGATIYSLSVSAQDDSSKPDKTSFPLPPSRSYYEYFVKASNGGARVLVAPWAGSAPEYNIDNQQVDDFFSSNPNILFVVAAGNDGTKGSTSIYSPANSKNALTVGSTQNSKPAMNFKPENLPAAARDKLKDPKYSSLFGETMLSSFSSRGPTKDLRIKPDVVAPGEIVYSASKTTCDQTVLSGTSISASLVAGAAALVRDYFKQKYYPTGTFNLGVDLPFPSSNQIKAILINSGSPLNGVDALGPLGNMGKMIYFGKTPDEYQGFGRVQLTNTLFFKNVNNPFFIETNETKAIGAGETITYCFSVPQGTGVKATLVWTDLAGSPSSSLSLVNDLDLVLVESFSGREYRANNLPTFDNLNNVEQVEIVASGSGDNFFTVYVHGTNIPAVTDAAPSQIFSLVISFKGKLPSDTLPVGGCRRGIVCPNLCSGNGACQDGVCKCNAGFRGVDCSISACPNNCGTTSAGSSNRRGICDAETSTCFCLPGYFGSDCTQVPAAVQVPTETVNTGKSTGTVIGAIVGSVVGGIILGLIVGFFVSVKTLENQRKKRRQQLLKGQGKF